MKQKIFQGFATAMVTPMTATGVDYDALARFIDFQLAEGVDMREEQDENLMTYAPKLLRPHGQIDWTQPALQISRKIRAYHSWPGTFTIYPSVKSGQDKTLKIYPPVDLFSHIRKPADAVPGMVLEAGPDGMLVSCGGRHGGAIRITTMQPTGARKMNAESFFAGHKIVPGTILGLPSTPNA